MWWCGETVWRVVANTERRGKRHAAWETGAGKMTQIDGSAGGMRSSGEVHTQKVTKGASKASGPESGRSGRPVFKSAFASITCDNDKSEGVAEAVEVEAKESSATGTNTTQPRKAPAGDKGKSRAQTSVFADYPDVGEENKEGGACESPTRNPVDIGRECSMMHRLMESDKKDVDPRDVHKLLPGQLLSSESLDLNVDLLQRAIANAAERELQREHASREDSNNSDEVVDEQEPDDNRPKDGDLEAPGSPASAPSFEASQLVQTSPRPQTPTKSRSRSVRPPRLHRDVISPLPHPVSVSPIPGWPSPPPMVHHVSPALGLPPLGARAPTPPSPYMDQRMSPIPMPVSSPYGIVNPVTSAVSMGPVPMPWSGYPPLQQMPNYALPGHMPVPTHPVPVEAVPLPGLPPQPVGTPMGPMPVQMMAHSPPPIPRARSAIPGEMRTVTPPGVRPRSATPEYDSGSPPPGSKDFNGSRPRRFRSVEAALAWCHVQHSQKQVPVVPKEDVKRLVEFQLNSGKPIRAPWYRPQKEGEEETANAESEVASAVKKDVEQQEVPVSPAPCLGKPPKPASALEPTQEKEGMQELEQITTVVSKPPRSPAPVRKPLSPTVRMSPSPPARMNPMAPMPMLSKTSGFPAPNEGDGQRMTTASVKMQVPKKMMPAAAWKPPQAPTSHKVDNPSTIRQLGTRVGSGAALARAHSPAMRCPGTGFFVPAGLPA